MPQPIKDQTHKATILTFKSDGQPRVTDNRKRKGELVRLQDHICAEANDWINAYYPKVGDVVTMRKESGQWSVDSINSSDMCSLISTGNKKQHDSLVSPRLLTPTKKQKPQRCRVYGATINREIWEHISAAPTLALVEQLSSRTITAGHFQLLADELYTCERLTKVSQYFPNLESIFTPEAVRCMSYRIVVMFNNGCTCRPPTHDDCPNWTAKYAMIRAEQIAQKIKTWQKAIK